jgi:hypothetical protein
MVDRPPRLMGAQLAGDAAGEVDLRLLPETHAGVQVPHLARGHLQRHLRGADVARLLHHLAHGQPPCECSSLIGRPVT